MPLSGAPGFFGKLPCRGDFVNRRLPTEFTARWDAWLQEGLARSQHDLAGQWLDVYLTSPIWRFALQGGVCGEHAYIGVFVPSVDRVGRYFPLTAAVACPATAMLPALAARLEPWFVSVEELLLETLADTPLELEDFDRRLAALELEDAGLRDVDAFAAAPAAKPDAAVCWQLDLAAGTSVEPSMSAIAASLATGVLRGHTYWWTQGSERIGPCLAATSALPAAPAFTALLDGQWGAHGWLPFRTFSPGAGAPASVFRYASAGFSEPGSRAVNEDSFAAGDEQGIWIVADGLGGHRAGDVASRMVTSIARVQRAVDLDRRIEDVARAIEVVNGCLQQLVPSGSSGDLVGSTVAALLLGDSRAVWLWAGDSRVYRLRDGTLTRLSRDHADTDETYGSRAVTRAVGAPGAIELDVERDVARADDRFLLCTDGLWGELYAEQIALALSLATPQAACDALRSTVAAGETPDNFTAVVVYVSTIAGTAHSVDDRTTRRVPG